jgi:hypothetical protein
MSGRQTTPRPIQRKIQKQKKKKRKKNLNQRRRISVDVSPNPVRSRHLQLLNRLLQVLRLLLLLLHLLLFYLVGCLVLVLFFFLPLSEKPVSQLEESFVLPQH